MSAHVYNPVNIEQLATDNMRALGMTIYAPGTASGMNSMSGSGTMGVADYLAGRNSAGRTMFNRQLAAGDLGALQLAQMTAAVPYPSREGDAYNKAVQNWTQVYGLGLNSPYVAKYFNGSAIDLGVGIQSMVSAAGARINERQVFGGGPFTDAVALDLYNNVQKNFFNGNLGIGNQKAFGFDKTEFGQIFAALGQRGAFSGMIESTVSQGPDGFSVTHGAGTVEKLNAKMAEASKSLGMLRDLFGATKNIAQLLNIAENVGGVDLADPKAFQNLQARVVRSTTRAISMGMDPRATMEYEAALAETYRSMGYTTTGAGTLSGLTMDAAQRRFSAYRSAKASAGADNVYMPHMDQAAFVGVQAGLDTRMIEHPESHAALMAYRLIQSGGLSGEQATTLRQALADTSDAGIENLRTTMAGMGFGDINTMIAKRNGAQAVFGSLSQESAMAFGRYTRSILERRSSDDLITSVLSDGTVYGNLDESKIGAADDMIRQMKSTLSSSGQVRVANLLRSGASADAIRQVLAGDSAGLSAAEQESMLSGLMGLGADFGNVFNRFNDVYNVSGGTPNSRGDRNQQSLAELQANRIYDNLTPTGKPLTQLLSGLAGGVSLSDQAVMTYIATQRPEDVVRVSEIGDITDEQMSKFLSPEEVAEFRDRIDKYKKGGSQKGEGAEIMRDLMERNRSKGGITQIAGEEGSTPSYLFANGTTVSNVKDSGVADMMLAYERALAFTTTEEMDDSDPARLAGEKAIREFSEKYGAPPDAITDPEGFAEYNKKRDELIGTAAFSKSVVSAALSGKDSDADRLKKAFATDKTRTQVAIQAAIEERQKQIDGMSDKDGKEARKVRDEIKKLEEAKAAGTNDYLGVLKLKIGDNFLVDLWKMMAEGKP